MSADRFRCTTRVVAALLIVLLQSGSSGAQDRRRDEQLTVAWVMFGVTPLERHLGGRSIGASWTLLDRITAPGGLQLEVDGLATEVDVLAAAEDPLELEILRDESRSMDFGERVERSREILDCVVRQLQSRDQVRIAGFAEAGAESVLEPTIDRAAARASLEQWPTTGVTSLLEALVWLARGERPRGGALRRVSLVVTDGGDNASRLTLRRARKLLAGVDHPVLVLDAAGHEAPYDQSRPTRASLMLDEIIHGTAGLRLSTASGERACRDVAQVLRSHLLVGFQVDSQSPHAERRLRLRLAPELRPRLRLRYRNRYVGQAPLARSLEGQ